MGGTNKSIEVFFYTHDRKEPKLIKINSNLHSIKSYLDTQKPKELALPKAYHLYFDPKNKNMDQLNRKYGIIGSFIITRKYEQGYFTLDEHDIRYLRKHDLRLINTQRKSEKSMSIHEKIAFLKNAASEGDRERIDNLVALIIKGYNKSKASPSMEKLVVYMSQLNTLSDRYMTPYIFTEPYFEVEVIKDYAKELSR